MVQKAIVFDQVNDIHKKPARDLTWPHPTVTVSEGFVLSKNRRLKLEILSQLGKQFYDFRTNFESKIFIAFENKVFPRRASFLSFFIRNPKPTLYSQSLIVLHTRRSQGLPESQ